MMMASDDMRLRIRITQLTTSRFDLTGETPLVVQLSGTVVGPIDNLLPIMQAQKLGRPLVEVALIAADELPIRDGVVDPPGHRRGPPDTGWHDSLDRG